MTILERIRYYIGENININNNEIRRISEILSNEMTQNIINILSIVEFYDIYCHILTNRREVITQEGLNEIEHYIQLIEEHDGYPTIIGYNNEMMASLIRAYIYARRHYPNNIKYH